MWEDENEELTTWGDEWFIDDKSTSKVKPKKVYLKSPELKKYCLPSRKTYEMTGKIRYLILKDEFRILNKNERSVTHQFILDDNKMHVVRLDKSMNTALTKALKANASYGKYNDFKQDIVIKALQRHIAIINRYQNIEFKGTLSEVLTKVCKTQGISKSKLLRRVIQDIIAL